MPTSSARGAVHILFLIVTLIIALAGWGLWFMQLQENETLEANAAAAQATAEDATTKLVFAEGAYQEVARYVGAPMPSTVNFAEDYRNTPAKEHYKTWTQQVDQAMQSLPARIEDRAARVDNLLQAWEPIISRYQAMKTEKGQLETQVANKNSQIQSLQEAAAQKDAQHVQTVEQAQLAAQRDQARLATQLEQVRTENTSFAERARTLNDGIETVREEANSERQRHLVVEKTMDGQVQNMKNKLTLERERETPDGEVLAVDPILKTVFIDVGGKNFLRRGTRFKVYRTGKGDEKIHKGWIRVVDVADSRAECRVDEVSHPRGVEAGDWIYNPYFNPSVKSEDKQHFAFVGQISGRYTREILESMLERRGAVIDPNVTIETDFLVVGQSEDPELGDITENPEYQKAKRWGIEMVRAGDLEPFLKN